MHTKRQQSDIYLTTFKVNTLAINTLKDSDTDFVFHSRVSSMSTSEPLHLFEPERLTESTVKECAEVLEQTVNSAVEYISKDKTDLTAIPYKRKLVNVMKALKEIDDMYKLIDKQYTEYMTARNKEVEELAGGPAVMRGYADHYIDYDLINNRIKLYVEAFKMKIKAAKEFDSAVMISQMRGFSSRFKSYFKVILDYHASKDKEMASHIAHTGRIKKRYNELMSIFRNHVEEMEVEFEDLFKDLDRKRLQFDELKKKVFLMRNEHTLSEFKGFSFEIDNLEISGLLDTIKIKQNMWSVQLGSDLQNLKRVATSCYLSELTMEAVGLKNKVDLKQIQFLGQSDDDIDKNKPDRVTDKFACLVARCFVLKKEAKQTRERIANHTDDAVIGVGGEWLAEFSQSRNSPLYLRKLLERLGVTYIKLGQFIASAPTLFPEEYVKEFQYCYDKAPVVPFDEIKSILHEELAGPIDSIYEYVDSTPLASASIAQVHAARLRGSQADVVIKVLKPGIEDVLAADLNFIDDVARIVEFLNPELSRASLVAVVNDIRASMLEEVDFKKEAANIVSFRGYLESMELTMQATAPKVHPEVSTKKVLTMERLNGVPLTDLDSTRSLVSSPETSLITALNV